MVHVAVDDATRLAYVEVLADEQKPAVIGFLSRAVAWFNSQGVECRQVMSDNGSAYVSATVRNHGTSSWRTALVRVSGIRIDFCDLQSPRRSRPLARQ
jgi:hypothetical protein